MEIFFSIVSIIGIIIVGFTLFLCIRKDIKTNELIEIRYVIRENKPIIISEIYKVRLDHLIIGVIGGVILSAICIILKINNIW